MQWLSNNFWNLFGGVGGTAVLAVIGFLLRRMFKGKDRPQMKSRDVMSSGTGNVGVGNIIAYGPTQIGGMPPHPAPPASVHAIPVTHSPLPKMLMTGPKVIRFRFGIDNVIEEDADGREALVIGFQNRAADPPNVGGSVKACLIYEDNGSEVMSIIGAWVDGRFHYATFEVDESHKLFVGFPAVESFAAVEMLRVTHGFAKPKPHLLPAFQTIRVRLTHADRGDILYEGRFGFTLVPLDLHQAE